MPLPEGRTPLTDGDMVILLHNIARNVESYGASNLKESELRQIADRFSELAKAAGVAQHKAQQG
jgi:hypothetical protein